MDIMEKEIVVKDYLTKSNLPASDYVINPYVGCSFIMRSLWRRRRKIY